MVHMCASRSRQDWTRNDVDLPEIVIVYIRHVYKKKREMKKICINIKNIKLKNILKKIHRRNSQKTKFLLAILETGLNHSIPWFKLILHSTTH
jgi:hypothetical protein